MGTFFTIELDVHARRAGVVLWITAMAAGALLAASPALAGGVRVQHPPTPGGGGLNGVQCFAGIGRCLAVGGTGCLGPLAEVWNGRVWSVADAGLPACWVTGMEILRSS